MSQFVSISERQRKILEVPKEIRIKVDKIISTISSSSIDSADAKMYAQALHQLVKDLWLHKDRESYSEIGVVDRVMLPFLRGSQDQDRFQKQAALKVRCNTQLQEGLFEDIVNVTLVSIREWNAANDRVKFSTGVFLTDLGKKLKEKEWSLFPQLNKKMGPEFQKAEKAKQAKENQEKEDTTAVTEAMRKEEKQEAIQLGPVKGSPTP